ncbi:MAG: hypothetical protein MUC88_09150 [Planctomycetes bacterium]|jgi:hypothetical protein|nr:hypothetical protein [Planctomycetota bacterium]
MKKLLLSVVVLAGLGCSTQGYRSEADPYRPPRDRIAMPGLLERSYGDGAPHWPLGPLDRDDP